MLISVSKKLLKRLSKNSNQQQMTCQHRKHKKTLRPKNRSSSAFKKLLTKLREKLKKVLKQGFRRFKVHLRMRNASGWKSFKTPS